MRPADGSRRPQAPCTSKSSSAQVSIHRRSRVIANNSDNPAGKTAGSRGMSNRHELASLAITALTYE